jgi:hypothetical protein
MGRNSGNRFSLSVDLEGRGQFSGRAERVGMALTVLVAEEVGAELWAVRGATAVVVW